MGKLSRWSKDGTIAPLQSGIHKRKQEGSNNDNKAVHNFKQMDIRFKTCDIFYERK